ncbi:MAG: hypothetical protein WD045_13645 [Pirellulaceae bacterium]
MSTLRETSLPASSLQGDSLQGDSLHEPAADLAPVLSERCILTWRQAALCGLLGVLFLLVAYLPLSHHSVAKYSVWVHLARGEAILNQGTLPTVDPVSSLSAGLAYVETSWLANTLLAWVASVSLHHLALLVTVVTASTILLLAGNAWHQTRNTAVVAGVAILGLLGMSADLTSAGPRMFAGLLFVVMLILDGRRVTQWTTWLAIPLIVLLWANLDAATVGIPLIYLALKAMGAALDGWRSRETTNERRGLTPPLGALFLAELALLVTLATPLGARLWWELIGQLQTTASALASGTTWIWASPAGIAMAALLLLAAVALRTSRLTLTAAELLPLAGLGLLALAQPAAVLWCTPPALLTLLPHLKNGLNIQADDPAVDHSAASAEEAQRPLRFAYSMVAVLVVWTTFAFSPHSHFLLGNTPRTERQLLDQQTPLGAVAYLRTNPVDGLVWAPAPWGDFLQAKQGAAASVYTGSAMENLPQQARFDYGKLLRGENGWESIADRYDIDCLVLDKRAQRAFVESAASPVEGWVVSYQDEKSLVLRRRDA